jgi:hypothetical protein
MSGNANTPINTAKLLERLGINLDEFENGNAPDSWARHAPSADDGDGTFSPPNSMRSSDSATVSPSKVGKIMSKLGLNLNLEELEKESKDVLDFKISNPSRSRFSTDDGNVPPPNSARRSTADGGPDSPNLSKLLTSLGRSVDELDTAVPQEAWAATSPGSPSRSDPVPQRRRSSLGKAESKKTSGMFKGASPTNAGIHPDSFSAGGAASSLNLYNTSERGTGDGSSPLISPRKENVMSQLGLSKFDLRFGTEAWETKV